MTVGKFAFFATSTKMIKTESLFCYTPHAETHEFRWNHAEAYKMVDFYKCLGAIATRNHLAPAYLLGVVAGNRKDVNSFSDDSTNESGGGGGMVRLSRLGGPCRGLSFARSAEFTCIILELVRALTL